MAVHRVASSGCGIARLESGDHEPSHRTLMRLASRLGLEFTISITVTDQEPTLLSDRARDGVLATYERDHSALRFAAASG